MGGKMSRRAMMAFASMLMSSSMNALAADPQVGLGSSSPAWVQAPKMAADAPNIIVILLDDTAYALGSAFGGPAATPALDQLAQRGLKYTRFHTAPTCSPTRAALLSGRNPHQLGFGLVSEVNNSNHGYNSFWPKSVASLPEILRRSGYSTGAFGKWHNTPTWEVSPAGPFDRWPTGLGFEYFYGFINGEVSQWEPPLYRDTTPIDPPRSPEQGYTLTEDLVTNAVTWIRTHEALTPEKPYFLYMAAPGTHAPHHVPKQWIAKYRGMFDQGWDRLSDDIFARQKALGILPPGTERTKRPDDTPAWDSLSKDQKRLYARQMEVLAAFMAYTDYELGRLLNAVRKGPKGDNTLIFYVAGDNGSSVSSGLDGSDRHLSAFVGVNRSVQEQLATIDTLGGPDADNHHSNGWAFALTTPFKGAKGNAAYFGSLRQPLVVSWPARIKKTGQIRSQFSVVTDVAATIFDVLHLVMPETVDGVAQKPIEGISIAPTFASPSAPLKRPPQYFESNGTRSLYADGWMAATVGKSGVDRQGQWELYYLDRDFSQSHDLAARYPVRLEALKAQFDAEAKRNGVYPLGSFDMEAMMFPGKSKPSIFGARAQIRLPGTTPRLPASAGPILTGSHSISATVDYAGHGTGVILSSGGRPGGYTLYVQNGSLIYESNFFGLIRSIIKSTHRIRRGHNELTFEFIKSGDSRLGGGTGKLFINGKLVGEGRVEKATVAATFDTFDVGADRGSPVSHAYQGPATFPGIIEEVRISLGSAAETSSGRGEDARGEAEASVRRKHISERSVGG